MKFKSINQKFHFFACESVWPLDCMEDNNSYKTGYFTAHNFVNNSRKSGIRNMKKNDIFVQVCAYCSG